MTKNNLLNIAVGMCKLFRVIYIVTLLALTALFFHLQVDKEFYKGKEVTIVNSDISFMSDNSNLPLKTNGQMLTLDALTTLSLYINYLRYAAILILLFLSIKEFQNIMESVKNLKTFKNTNVKSFRRIGNFTLIYFLLSSFYSFQFEHVGYSGFTMSFTPLIVMLFTYIMAEIFKEGNLLREENKLTI